MTPAGTVNVAVDLNVSNEEIFEMMPPAIAVDIVNATDRFDVRLSPEDLLDVTFCCCNDLRAIFYDISVPNNVNPRLFTPVVFA